MMTTGLLGNGWIDIYHFKAHQHMKSFILQQKNDESESASVNLTSLYMETVISMQAMTFAMSIFIAVIVKLGPNCCCMTLQ